VRRGGDLLLEVDAEAELLPRDLAPFREAEQLVVGLENRIEHLGESLEILDRQAVLPDEQIAWAGESDVERIPTRREELDQPGANPIEVVDARQIESRGRSTLERLSHRIRLLEGEELLERIRCFLRQALGELVLRALGLALMPFVELFNRLLIRVGQHRSAVSPRRDRECLRRALEEGEEDHGEKEKSQHGKLRSKTGAACSSLVRRRSRAHWSRQFSGELVR